MPCEGKAAPFLFPGLFFYVYNNPGKENIAAGPGRPNLIYS